MKDFNVIFEQEIDRLNNEQKTAVETIEGPVLVIAGPGTGKTQIIAARIGNILRNTDSHPENILCLTYTDAGTVAMRNRLFKFIGPDAYRVNIYTFHAFCNKVIQDNLDAFGIRDLDPISELEEIDLYRKLIDSFDARHPLKRWTGDVYYEMGRLKRLFRLMKTENWSPEEIINYADEYLSDCKDSDDFYYKRAITKKGVKAGDFNQDKYDKECRKMEELKAAAKEYPNFQQMMQDSRRYDYDDMILWVLNKFKEDADLLLTYQEQYHYFLVDEYQDTNGAQNAILHELINYWDAPNVFVVGDDDQSIYRFQGANVTNILSFYKKYQDTVKVVVMKDNYRSVQSILDTAKSVIDLNKERLVTQIRELNLTKDLEAKNPETANLQTLPVVRQYYNLAHETVHISKEIEQLHQKGIDLSEVAIIYRNHRQSEDIAKYLSAKGIPINIKRKEDILHSPFISKLIQILQYIEGESRIPHSREDLLFEILHFDFFDIDPLIIAKMAAEIRNRYSSKEPIYWRQEIKNAHKKISNTLFDNEDDESYQNIKSLSDNIEYWIKSVHNITLQGLFEKIVTRGGILAYVMRSPFQIHLMEELNGFFDFMKTECQRDTSTKLKDFLKTIDMMLRHDISLPMNKTTFSEEGVNLITAHSSKGLEFEYIYLIGCNSKDWDKASRSYTYSLPDNLVAQKSDQGDDVEESRRLFYVALTRAKKHLFISYAAANNDGKECEKSRFVAEILGNTDLTEQVIQLEDDQLADYYFHLMKEEQKPMVKLLDKDYLKSILENYSLSVTHLSTYLKCPVSFYFNNLLRVPSAKNEYMQFGSAVHFALDRLFKKMKDNKDQFPSAEELVNDFEWHLSRHKDAFTEEQFTRRIEYGREILPKYYDQYINQWNRVVSTERILQGVVVNGVPIKGQVDKIEFNGHQANVVDYKTGKYSNARKKFDPPLDAPLEDASFEEKYGGDYWRQAVFYKILIDNDALNNWKVVTTEFDFIEPDPREKTFKKHKVPITEIDVTIVSAQIREAYENIMNQEFTEGCGDEYCKWCNFINSNYKVLSEEQSEEVEL